MRHLGQARRLGVFLHPQPQPQVLFAIVGAEYVLNLVPRGTHEYATFIRPSELAAFERAAGLQLQEAKGMEYNPLTRRYWLSGDTSVNYMHATRKPA